MAQDRKSPVSRWWRTQGPDCWLVCQQSWSVGSRACGIFIESVFLLLAFQCHLSLWTLLMREGTFSALRSCGEEFAVTTTSFTLLGTL